MCIRDSNNDMKEIINNINYLINEGRNNSNKINESLNSLIDKIKNQIKDLDKSSQEDSMYENLDTCLLYTSNQIQNNTIDNTNKNLNESDKVNFTDVLNNAVNKVNDSQVKANNDIEALIKGDDITRCV